MPVTDSRDQRWPPSQPDRPFAASRVTLPLSCGHGSNGSVWLGSRKNHPNHCCQDTAKRTAPPALPRTVSRRSRTAPSRWLAIIPGGGWPQSHMAPRGAWPSDQARRQAF
jgi:hypothetical protein